MILTRLVLENYGAYEGRNELDLETSPERPIVLIGGVNGAGKTTILDSILLGLYGRSIFGRGMSSRKYRDYLSKLVHRKNRHRAKFAAVEIEFRLHHSGSEDTYLVRREWESVGDELDFLSVSKNGVGLDGAGRETWQQFMDSLVPPGIARIFFFDGEKIARIAEDVSRGAGGGDKGTFRASMDTMLGIDLIRQLRTDLNLYIMRSGGKGASVTMSEYDRILGEKRNAEEEMSRIRAEMETKAASLEKVEKKVMSLESHIRGLGGEYARRRGELIAQRSECSESARMLEVRLRDALSGHMVLGVIGGRLAQVASQVRADSQAALEHAGAQALEQRAADLGEKMGGGTFWEGTGVAQTDREAVAARVLGELSSGDGQELMTPAFDISRADATHILEISQRVPAGVGELMADATRHGKAAGGLAEAETKISMAPRDDEIGPLVGELNGLNEESGMLKAEMRHLEERLASHDYAMRSLKKRLGAIVDGIKKTDRGVMGVKLATDAIDTLEAYEARIKRVKMAGMEQCILESIRHLMHKEDFITSVSVDADDYGIELYGKGGESIPRESLSKGEMQMLATAVLWSMVKVSEKPLPFVIDTPLARLDAEHRANLLERFYPSASHQVIILSTDTEIRAAEHKSLEGHISRSYTISYDAGGQRTAIRDGYLAGEEGIAVEA